MKDLPLSVPELKAKANAARTDVQDVAALGLLPIPAPGTSFRIDKMIYVWVPGDVTAPDGASSIKSAAAAAGRYRRVTLRMPFMK